MPSSLHCACCPKSSTLVCSACKSAGLQVAYCSVKHQKLVWSTHKLICGRVLEQCFIPPISQLETVIELLHNPGLPYSSLVFEVSEDAYNLNCWTPGFRESALQIHEQRISTTVNVGTTLGRRSDLVNLIKAYRDGKLHLIPRPRIPPFIPLYLQAYHMLNDCLKTLIFKIPPDDWTRTLSIPSLIEYTNSIVIYATVYVQSGLIGGVIKFKDVPIDLQSSLRELWERMWPTHKLVCGRVLERPHFAPISLPEIVFYHLNMDPPSKLCPPDGFEPFDSARAYDLVNWPRLHWGAVMQELMILQQGEQSSDPEYAFSNIYNLRRSIDGTFEKVREGKASLKYPANRPFPLEIQVAHLVVRQMELPYNLLSGPHLTDYIQALTNYLTIYTRAGLHDPLKPPPSFRLLNLDFQTCLRELWSRLDTARRAVPVKYRGEATDIEDDMDGATPLKLWWVETAVMVDPPGRWVFKGIRIDDELDM